MRTKRSAAGRRVTRAHRARGGGKRLVVFGAGGNIGSHLVPLGARLPGVTGLTLVDPDRYEPKNVRTQAIAAADIGRAKARVQARIAQQINPALEVLPIVDRLENVPLGCLRGDVILACLDSKESRRAANAVAWRLGVPLIDAGVEPSLMLARVNVYLPAAGQPCLECAWGEQDYAKLATIHPCDAARPETPPSNSPACLGALTAALQAIECQKLISGQAGAALVGRQVVIEASSHRQFLTAYRLNPRCRFSHETWKISPINGGAQDLSVASVLELAGPSCASAALGFGGRPLVKRLDCPRCGFTRRTFRLQGRLRPRERFCARCGREMLSAGFHMQSRLARADLSPAEAGRSLASLGLREGDVISLSHGAGEKYFELRGNS